jgi:hypothetical protein
MVSKAEQCVSRSLRAILGEVLNGASVAGSEHLQDVLDGLEFFIPEVLRELHHEWDYESLDGFIPVVARKVGCENSNFSPCAFLSPIRHSHRYTYASKFPPPARRFLGLSVSFERKETMEWFGRRMNYWIEPSSRYTFWQAKKTG